MNSIMADTDWEAELLTLSANESWDHFSTSLNAAMTKCIPKSVTKKNGRRKIWMTREATAKFRKKQRAWKQYQKSKDHLDYVRATTEKNEFTMLVRNINKDFEQNLAKNLKHNPKDFWRYCNSKMKSKSRLGDLQDKDGKLTNDDSEKAELLNDYFTSVFTRENLENIPNLSSRINNPPPVEVNFTPEIVEKKLNKLKTTKSAGPDGFHPRILSELAKTVKTPLSIIFKKSYDENRLPKAWKDAHITAIHKKGKKVIVGNYRPVSLTSIIGKMMESIIRDRLVDHMMEHKLFCDPQHGFVPGRSCMTQLLTTLEIWSEILDSGAPIDAIYLDFRKAFDTVPHQRLLAKLEAYGITGNTLGWIRNFLLERRQRVVVNGKLSAWALILSGIPQGSVLGPILFVIFINDLPDVVTSMVKIFADDTKLFHSVHSPQHRIQLQNDLDNLVEWSRKWQLGFNEAKCKVIHLGKSNPRHQYVMNDVTLESTADEKDLGVVVDEDLKFHLHVSKAVSKASRMLGLVRATFSCLDESTVPRLFTTMVRPHLEYGNIIWHPRYRRDKLEVEKIQRRATRLIPSLKGMSYEERLRALKLPSLEHRRRRGDMIQVFKILKGIDRLDPDQFFTMSAESTTRGHGLKMMKTFSRLGVRQNVFSQRVVNDWNSFPAEVVESPTLNTFKSRLDKFWQKERFRLP